MTDDITKQRIAARMSRDFEPMLQGTAAMSLNEQTLLRLAHAADYIAFQLGQINRKMDTAIEALKAKAT